MEVQAASAASEEDYDASGAAAPPDIVEDRLDEAPRTRPAAGENGSTRSEQFDAGEVWRALAEARRQALAVYARHKLPLTPALYQRRGDRHAWRPAEEAMTAEQRWAFVLDGAEAGWRLVGLERVGRIGRARVIEVQMAAGILALTEALRRRLPELDDAARADIGRAFELGRLTAEANARAEMVRRRKRRRDRLRAARAKMREGVVRPEG